MPNKEVGLGKRLFIKLAFIHRKIFHQNRLRKQAQNCVALIFLIAQLIVTQDNYSKLHALLIFVGV